jgi:IS5 family transposase
LLDRHVTGKRRRTLGADKGYDVAAFVIALRDRRVAPHIAAGGSPRCPAMKPWNATH